MQQEQYIYPAVTATLNEKPKYEIRIPVSGRKRAIWNLFNRIGETERTFIIYPCKVCNMYRIAGVAAKLPSELKGGTYSEVYLPLINAHLKDIVYVIAAGIQNNRNEPARALTRFIEDNFDAIDLFNTLQPVLENVNMEAFFNSIVLIKGTVKILQPKEEKTSPKDGSELIASHTAQ